MIRILFITLFALFLSTVYSAKVSQLGIEVVEDIAQFKSEFPNVKLIPLQRAGAGLQDIRYTLGTRITADRIVAQGNNNYVYPSPQDVQLKLNYPQYGTGAIVSYVEILVSQNIGAIGNAYVVSGGIGQRSITIVVEAKRATNFSYRAAIYGY